MTAPDLLDLGDLVADARNVAELILMAHRRPEGDEDKAVAAAAHQITGLLDRVQEGLAVHASKAAPTPAENAQALDRARLIEGAAQ